MKLRRSVGIAEASRPGEGPTDVSPFLDESESGLKMPAAAGPMLKTMVQLTRTDGLV